MKSLRDLFIKDDETEPVEPEKKPAFPVSQTSIPLSQNKTSQPSTNQYLEEIVEVYEKGLDSINMPGYDFYDFYLAIRAGGEHSEAVYKIAFQMGKTMDSNVTAQKLAGEADFYISKINEVYRTYSEKGTHKLQGLERDLNTDRENLTRESGRIEGEIAKMRQQIIALEQKLAETRNSIATVDGKYKPQQDIVRGKLQANEHAMELSIQKINSVKDGILKYIK